MKKTGHSAGFEKFEYLFTKLQALMTQAGKQKNPALWLYRNNARAIAFMAEGLAKIYAGIYDKKIFAKIDEQAKLLEDALGLIDYYDVMAKGLVANKKIPRKAISYLQAQTREKIQSLNELLTEKHWLGSTNNKIEKLQKKLRRVEWLSNEKEVKQFAAFYTKSIGRIIFFVQQKKFRFDNLETEVHELRRQLRWLSIYPHALQGTVQLTGSKHIPSHLKKYMTSAVLTSPFNKMPDAGDTKHFLMLDKNIFYSLSWMIAELGIIKDKGLQILALQEVLQQTGSAGEADLKKVYQLLKQEKLPDLLKYAMEISKTYFGEHNLERLVAGTGKL